MNKAIRAYASFYAAKVETINRRNIVMFPDFKPVETGVFFDPKTDDLYEVASAYLDDLLAHCRENRKPPPQPSASGDVYIPIPRQTAAKFMLLEAFQEATITTNELALRLELNEKQVRRLLDPFQITKLSTLERALRALGKMLIFATIDTKAIEDAEHRAAGKGPRKPVQ
jgi:antitoxin HicB